MAIVDLNQATSTQDDLDFYKLCVPYVGEPE